MEGTAENRPRVIAVLRNLARTLVGIAANRVELAAGEAREEFGRWLESLLLTAALVTMGALAVAVITLAVVVACGEEHRLAALAGLGVFYALATLAFALRLRWRLQHWPSFSATLNEVEKDKAWLSQKSETSGSSADKP